MRARADTRRERMLRGLLALAVSGLLRLLGPTWRLRVTGDDPLAPGTPVVAAMWHGGLFVAAWVWRGRGIAVPVSRSRDGERAEAVLRRLGFGPSPRGSSSRGATALLREMIRRVQGGDVVGVLADGPRGPARRAKPGVLAVARATGVPIVPVGVAAAPSLRLGSWDAARVPLPFARVRCHYGEPLHVPKSATDAELEALRRELEDRLDHLDAQLAAELGGAPAPALEAPGGRGDD